MAFNCLVRQLEAPRGAEKTFRTPRPNFRTRPLLHPNEGELRYGAGTAQGRSLRYKKASLGAAEDKVSFQFFTGTPMRHCRFTTQVYHSSVQNAPGLPQSRLKSILGRPNPINANCPTARVDAYGHSFKKPWRASNTTEPGSYTTSSRTCFQRGSAELRFHTWAASAASSTCKDLFNEFANQLPELGPNNFAHAAALRFRQGIIADLKIDPRPIPLREFS